MAAPGPSHDLEPNPHNLQQHESSSTRSASPMSETARPLSHHPEPLEKTVSNAVHGAESSNHVPPELIEQITQSVIKQLQNTGLDGSTPTQAQNQFPPPPPPPHHSHHHHEPPPAPLSPSSTSASGTSPNMPNRVFTPPSPQRHSDYLDATSPPISVNFAPEPPMSPPKGFRNATFSPNRPSSPTSQASNASDGHGERSSRPKGPTRLHTGMEETTLEKIWGPLFDEQSRPTSRLSQFLRGLAVHIIEDYAPRHSLVITPDKMVRYYRDVQLENELYPWSIVFDDERSSISRMYRELSCQHHLVQERFDERPDIPGLTPVGFERWVTLLIQAHPEAEYERLAKAVLHMPINNPDDKKERFPKEITRRLFPKHEDIDIRYEIEDAMIEHASIEIPRLTRRSQDDIKARQESPTNKTSLEPTQPPNGRPSVSFAEPEIIPEPKPSYVPSHVERERAPYSNVPESAVVDDTNAPEPAVTKPIERERKPYSAQVGGGRQYEAEEVRPRDGSTRPRAESIANSEAKPVRSDSTAPRTRPIPINSNGHQIPKPEIHQHQRGGSNLGNSRRRRSPSFSQGGDYRREIDAHNYRPSFDVGSIPRSGPGDAGFDEADTKRYFENQARERARRKAEEDARAYGESPRRHEILRPKRADYGNDEEYWRARDRRDRSYDDGHREPYGSYR